MNVSKKVFFTTIGVAVLLIALVGVTFSFFNYTRTGPANTVGTGTINFLTTQNNTLSLTDLFPVESTDVGNDNAITLRIQGDTTYDGGEEFEITIVDVNNTVGTSPNEVEVPINFLASYAPTSNGKNIGSEAVSDYFTERGSTTTVYELTETGVAENGKKVLVGFIPKNGSIDGTLTIKAYLDKNNVIITDTLVGTEPQNSDFENGTTASNETTVLTTDEWNTLSNSQTPLSFKIKAESREGTWVSAGARIATFDTGTVVNAKIKLLVGWIMGYNSNDYNYTGQNLVNNSVTDEIHFDRSDTLPNETLDEVNNVISSSNSPVKIYAWQEMEGYEVHIKWYTDADEIYLNEDSSYMFMHVDFLASLEGFDDVNMSNVTNMSYMFAEVTDMFADISDFDTSNVRNMSHMFEDCYYIDKAQFASWDVGNVTDMSYMFKNTFNGDDSQHRNASALNGWDISNVTNFTYMFASNKNYLDQNNVTLSSFVYPTFTNRPGTWNNDVVQIENRNYYAGTYVPNS